MGSIDIQITGFAIILTFIFAVLKLAGKIAWSWWWVFSPVWTILGLIVLILIWIAVITLKNRL